MERARLAELGFENRDEAVGFLKKLWNGEETVCPICGTVLISLHKKAKKDSSDWQCKNCDKSYRTMYLLDEINEQMK